MQRPQVILIDDVPVYGQDLNEAKRTRRDAGYFVLVVAELPASREVVEVRADDGEPLDDAEHHEAPRGAVPDSADHHGDPQVEVAAEERAGLAEPVER
mgnify:CR=1 FL=1